MRFHKQTPRRAFSLLEMAAASALVAGTLVPALAVVRDSMATSREMHRRNLLANYAVRILEDQTGTIATNWTNGNSTGSFASDGYATIRYSATTSDNPSDGGLVSQLMSVSVTVYDDADNDSNLDAGELNETYRTKVAKLNTYENEEQ